MKNGRKLAALLLGPGLYFLLLVVLPSDVFFRNAASAIGTIAWMAVWWVTLPVDPGVTAFIPLIVNTFIQMVPMNELMAKYASDTFFLLLGADLISITWEVTGLDRRIALRSLGLIGPSMNQQIAVWVCVSAVLSVFLPNAVVCAMLTPIAISMLKYVKIHDIGNSAVASLILLAIAWGAGIGGLGSPLGGAMNLVAIDYIQMLTGKEFMYVTWVIRMLPFFLVIVLLNIGIIMLVKPKHVKLEGTREYYRTLYQQLPPMNRDELVSLALFTLATVLSFARPLYAAYLPGLKPAFVFLLFGMLGFVLRRSSGEAFLDLKTAEKKVFWGLIFMFGGGLAMGMLIEKTGAAQSIADLISVLYLDGGFLTILAFVSFTVILSEISSNTSAAAISLPIVISIIKGLNKNPIPYIYIVIAAFNCAYMLPTTIRSIPVGYGLKPRYMLEKGALLTVGSILVISVLGYLLLKYWELFSMV